MTYSGGYTTGYIGSTGLEPYEFKFLDAGVILNSDPFTPEGSFVDITKVTGLSSAPYRTTERDREGMDGGFIDAEFEKMRTIVLEGTAYATVENIIAFLDLLKENYAPVKEPLPFYFHAPNIGVRVAFCKAYGVSFDWDTALRTGTSPVQFILTAEDPTIYEAIPTTVTCSLPVEGAGRGYDKAFDYGYGGPNSGGFIAINNAGNKPANAIITIQGPVINPIVTHDTTGKFLSFNITVGADQFLTIDLRNRTVLLNGSSNRRSALINTSRWFLLLPGDNSFRFGGTDPVGGAPDPLMTIQARGAYR